MYQFHAKKETKSQTYYQRNKQKCQEKAKERARAKKQERDELQQRRQRWEEHCRSPESQEIAKVLLLIRTVVLNSKFDEIFARLKIVPLKTNYRKFIKMAWSFHLGYTTQALGASFFETPHPIRIPPWSSLGCDVRSPLDKGHPPYQKDLFVLATEVMQIVDPEFVRLQYVVHFAEMSSDLHYCPVHVDPRDTGPQYIIHFGEWEGAELRAYNTLEEKRTATYCSFNQPRRVVFIDSRMAHEVFKTKFKGLRFTLIVYHLWREDMFLPAPYLFPPRVLN
jgi:hypothetical protein